jgi:GNAT superfamily N-acetyltransferase
MGRLVEALNACWLPHAEGPGPAAPGQAPFTLAGFKRDIRERHVWCSSCMIAVEAAAPIGVLIGAKRTTETLVDRIAVRPDRMRLGHGRHMLDSLGAKLAILGPPRLLAEIPAGRPDVAAFFEACGFAPEHDLTDWILEDGRRLHAAAAPGRPAPERSTALPAAPFAGGDALILPTTVADLAANGLLSDGPGSSWDRATATLLARADILQGLAIATIDRILAFALYRSGPAVGEGAIVDALGPIPGRPDTDDAARRSLGARLLAVVLERTGEPIRISRIAEDEIPADWLREWGFRAVAGWRRHAATARAG